MTQPQTTPKAEVIDATRADGAMLARAPRPFDAGEARRSCEAVIAECQRLDNQPRRSSVSQARDDLKGFGRAMFGLLRAVVPDASTEAVSEMACAVTMLYSPSLLSLEREAARVVSVVDAAREASR